MNHTTVFPLFTIRLKSFFIIQSVLIRSRSVQNPKARKLWKICLAKLPSWLLYPIFHDFLYLHLPLGSKSVYKHIFKSRKTNLIKCCFCTNTAHES